MSTANQHPLQALSGVGPQLASKLEKIGISKPQDLLFHLPLRYQDRTRVSAIGSLEAGENCLVIGTIDASEIRFGRRRSLLVSISDETGNILLRFFHFSRNQQQSFREGAWIHCFGEPRRGKNSLEMVHPEYRIYEEKPVLKLETSLTPVYPGTEGLRPGTLRKLVSQVLINQNENLKDTIPQTLQSEFGLMPLNEAINLVHSPPSNIETEALMNGTHPAQQRLAFEELLAHHLALTQLRQKRNKDNAPKISSSWHSWQKLESSLDFILTHAQQRVISEVFADISRTVPTLRLIQGDVGSGKTIVAAAAALCAIDNHFQVALMAPTELLAEQHRNTFESWFGSLGIRVQWLAGKMSADERRQSLEKIQSGESKMIIGTHALFQDEVKFQNLGLLVIDEQHRFGVDQRLALRNKANLGDRVPHQLIMSATPIPRSLAMIFYADLDVSSIDELPPGRQQVTTVVLPSTRRQEVISRINRVCGQGHQVYWVCPLIEESDKLQAQAATETCTLLTGLLPELKIELIHGKLHSRDKESIMEQFSSGNTDLLVATTVIEVGVDVPNANLMIIENAERLGLAQLHQLRGRVGRGGEKATCLLLYQSPLGTLARERLGTLRDTNDGFKIAQKDLEHRGPGELLGAKQTGLQGLKIADLTRDRGMLPKIERIANRMRDEYPNEIDYLVSQWIERSEDYANA